MPVRTGEIGFWCGMAAATATIAYDIVQVLQGLWGRYPYVFAYEQKNKRAKG